ncbi:ATP-binding protein [Streptomyces sp. BK79]|uniref:ATP-binding protein n=1 Tax=Streptomyces sp. BK79 TaxID=3350097 RepID=UPI00376FB211
MTAPARPGDRSASRALASVALPCLVVSALAVGGAVAAAPASVRLPLGLGGSAAAILLCVAVTVAVHAVRRERATRRLLDAARADAAGLAQDRARLAEEARREQDRLRAEAERQRERLRAEAAGERERLAAEFGREREGLTAGFEQERARLADLRDQEVARLTEDTARLRARLDRATGERAAAVAATANAAARMQALATGMLADLRAMEERHGDEDVLADLLHLDHRTAQAGRLADSVAVLTGARSGRRWARPIRMESILRGAMGRIAGYQRVRVHSASGAAVAGHAAEGVMHALAELLDNAANFSPPTAEVHVYVEEVPAGVIVSVEDSGLVMGEVQLRRAQRAVSGETDGIGGLTGTRLGLAVVGRLSAKYGLKVSFRPSARGGTGVLMLIPQDILSGPAAAGRPAASPPLALPAGAPHPAEPASGTGRGGTGPTPAGDGAGAHERLPATEPGAQSSLPATEPGAQDSLHATGPHAGAPPSATEPHTDGWLHATDIEAHERLPDHAPAAPEPSTARTSAGRAPDAAGAAVGPVEAVPALPKRRRGRTLAAAEHARAGSPSAEPRPAPPAGDAKERAARFSSFRQAVRATSRPDRRDDAPQTDPAPAETAPDHPSHSPAHPEGDTTP